MNTKLTVKELSVKTNVAEGTIRAWIMKPVDGVPYSKENINYENLTTKLNSYFEKFEEQFGFKASDIEIVRAERSTKKWIEYEDIRNLKVGTSVVLHNYSLKTELIFVGNFIDATTSNKVEEQEVILMFVTNKGEYKGYNFEQLSKENIKMELAE